MAGLTILAIILGFVIAIVVHESAHAYMADRLGDPTARSLGRVSLNPVHHVDPVGTILIPAILIISGTPFVFGWAKPVPINIYNFRDPLKGRLLTALAGPLANFATAAVFGVLYRLAPANTSLPMLIAAIVMINLVLMIFNLIPIPPLDGSAILPFIFKNNAELLNTLERQGVLFLLGLLILDSFMGGIIFDILIRRPVSFFLQLFLGGMPALF